MTTTSMTALDPSIEWLLHAEKPVVRHWAQTELASMPVDDPRLVEVRSQIARGPIVSRLLAGLGADGADTPARDWYSKWRAATGGSCRSWEALG